ncbi:hypothetical protein ACFYMW_20925 [Streptomyces sp. NPDC006692]|uniref:hypothetical protein n=1 Tax=Streptomyces sp. NPDC006692 TaxID=3364758 RepID=UPI0036C8DE8A
MFEIRVICDRADADRITTSLNTLFATGAVRRSPSRTAGLERLYVTADHRPDPQTWPTPEQAYADAPCIADEIGWTVCVAGDPESCAELDREYFLRKAAVFDRIALSGDPDIPYGSDTETAHATALYLMDLDHASVICDPRAYVRQQYAQWTKNQ